jgi:hypothetical protein
MAESLLRGQNYRPSEGDFTREGRSGDYSCAAQDRVGAKETALVPAQVSQQPPADGTAASHLRQVAVNRGLVATEHVHNHIANMKAAMRSVREGGPLMIALVQWLGRGAHWVLVVRRDTHVGRASTYTVLDPAGLVVRNCGSTRYTAPYHQVGGFDQVGGFGGFYVLINGLAPPPARRQVLPS